MTNVERALWVKLRAHRFNGIGFRRQVPIGPFIVDFVSHACRLVIELDGGQHAEDEAIERDQRRTRFIEAEGYRVIRFWNTELVENMDAVVYRIAVEIGIPNPEWLDSPLPDPPPQGGRGRKRRARKSPAPAEKP